MEFPLMSQLRVKFSPAQAADPDCLLPLDDEVICMSFVVWLCAVATLKNNDYYKNYEKNMYITLLLYCNKNKKLQTIKTISDRWYIWIFICRCLKKEIRSQLSGVFIKRLVTLNDRGIDIFKLLIYVLTRYNIIEILAHDDRSYFAAWVHVWKI